MHLGYVSYYVMSLEDRTYLSKGPLKFALGVTLTRLGKLMFSGIFSRWRFKPWITSGRPKVLRDSRLVVLVVLVLEVSVVFAALVELVMFVFVAFPAVGKTIGSIPTAVRFGAKILQSQATHMLVRPLIILFFFFSLEQAKCVV
jgi:hypothetical protein